MWTTEQLGLATWFDGQSTWCLDVRGGRFGIGLNRANGSSSTTDSVDRRPFSILPVGDDLLPEASEQFIRGDRYFVNYPQGDSRYAIRLALQPMHSISGTLVLEATVSIQTDLLDSHPTLDLVAFGRELRTIDPSESSGQEDWRSEVATPGRGAPAISVVRGDEISMAVLLGPHDAPFTSNLSSERRLCLRLFGDFLEKGVIRTARPWIVIEMNCDAHQPQDLRHWHHELSQSPVPLSS
jgi:hypothetical protein